MSCKLIGKISPDPDSDTAFDTAFERIAGSAPSCFSNESAPALEAPVNGTHLLLTPDGDLLIGGNDRIQRMIGLIDG